MRLRKEAQGKQTQLRVDGGQLRCGKKKPEKPEDEGKESVGGHGGREHSPPDKPRKPSRKKAAPAPDRKKRSSHSPERTAPPAAKKAKGPSRAGGKKDKATVAPPVIEIGSDLSDDDTKAAPRPPSPLLRQEERADTHVKPHPFFATACVSTPPPTEEKREDGPERAAGAAVVLSDFDALRSVLQLQSLPTQRADWMSTDPDTVDVPSLSIPTLAQQPCPVVIHVTVADSESDDGDDFPARSPTLIEEAPTQLQPMPTQLAEGTQPVADTPPPRRTLHALDASPAPPPAMAKMSVSEAVELVGRHSAAAKPLISAVLTTLASVVPRNELPPAGTQGWDAVVETCRAMYASYLLKRVATHYDTFVANKDARLVDTDSTALLPWTAVYAPRLVHETAAPCRVVMSPPPIEGLRRWLQDWRMRVVLGEEHRLQASLDTTATTLAVLGAAILSHCCRTHIEAVLVLQRVGQGLLARGGLVNPFPKRKKRRSRDYLTSLRNERHREGRPRRAALLAKRMMGSYDYDSEEDRRSENDTTTRPVLLRGPVGCGKTAAVYAAAAEAGFQLIEISSNRKRSREELLAALRDAMQSRLMKSDAKAPVPDDAREAKRPPSPPKLRQKKRIAVLDDDDDEEPPARKQTPPSTRPPATPAPPPVAAVKGKGTLHSMLGLPPPKKPRTASPAPKPAKKKGAPPPRPAPSPPPEPSPSLLGSPITLPTFQGGSESKADHIAILFEGADVVFDDESSFFSALRTLAFDTKCPVVITATTLSPALLDLRKATGADLIDLAPSPRLQDPVPSTIDVHFPHAAWPGVAKEEQQLGLGGWTHLLLILLAEGFRVPAPLLHLLHSDFQSDIRRALNTLQVVLHGRSRPAIYASDPSDALMPRDVDWKWFTSSLGLDPRVFAGIESSLLGFSDPHGVEGLIGSSIRSSALFDSYLVYVNYLRFLGKEQAPPSPPDYRPVPQHTPERYPSLADFLGLSPVKSKRAQGSTNRDEGSDVECTIRTGMAEVPCEDAVLPPALTLAMPSQLESHNSEGDLFGDTHPANLNEESVTNTNTPLEAAHSTRWASASGHANFTEAWVDLIRSNPTTRATLQKSASEVATLDACAKLCASLSSCDVHTSAARRAEVEELLLDPREGTDPELGTWWERPPLDPVEVANVSSVLALQHVVSCPHALPPDSVRQKLHDTTLASFRDGYTMAAPTLFPGVVITGPLTTPNIDDLRNHLFSPSDNRRAKHVGHRHHVLTSRWACVEYAHAACEVWRVASAKATSKILRAMTSEVAKEDWEELTEMLLM